jgi:phosphoserine aminotransferase
MDRVYNFSAGPSCLPLPVLNRVQHDLVNYPGAGCSVLEMSHRSRPFEEIAQRAQDSLRRLMAIGPEYSVLFLQGGASLQFSMIPMNLARRGQTVNYAVTGHFARLAAKEAERWSNVVTVTTSAGENYARIPKLTPDMLSRATRPIYISPGTTRSSGPPIRKSPRRRVSRSWPTVVYYHRKGVQRPRFCAHLRRRAEEPRPRGLTVVIVRNDLLEIQPDPLVPTMLQYKVMAQSDSMYNTPPCFAIYVAGLVFEWIEEMGGVAEMERRNREKSALLYGVLDASKVFTPTAHPDSRSIMNVTLPLPDKQMTRTF